MRTTKQSIVNSVVALVLCLSMLIGTTFAWFTDVVTSSGNIIQTGNLDIGMYWSENNVDWNTTEGSGATPIFSYDNWEPGYTQVRYIKVTNEGSLAFQYQMLLSPNGEVGKLAEVIDVSYDVVTGNDSFVAPTAEDKQGSLVKVGNLNELIESNEAVAGGVLLPSNQLADGYYSGEIVICVSFHMDELAGNEYQESSIGSTFDIKLYATQFDFESDSFDSSYDDEAEWPNKDLPFEGNSASVDVETDENGNVANPATIQGEGMSASIPVGVKLANGASKLTLSVNTVDESAANVTVAENENMRSIDVHIDGVASDNTVPMAITLNEALPIGLNLGNFTLHHVENGNTVAMTLIADGDTPVHNSFSYDPVTGNVVLYLASFSEIAFVAGEAKWGGEYDYSWYNTDASVYYIANADQLAGFGAIVGGMAEGIKQDSFTGKTVRLMSNINLGDYEDANPNLLFHPIGYYYNKNDSAPYSTVYSFEGTFDGNGNKIANFYQNTWEIKGDYDGNYYKDAMGLFGYVVNGTIKNLTVDHFSSDGEFTPTGVIAAYACNSTFENIAITNCNPRVYNTGNGGIVGIGGNSDDPDTYQLKFENITIDNTNKISSLWGSWDTACGGLIGMFRGAGHVEMKNCHVGAQIDVYNDVCGNYQYYWYRYSGILIGTNKNMYTDANGYTVPETEKFHAEKCTVHFGDWNDYYYCELVANSLASYTHDHQFSRLTEIASLSEIKNGDTWTKTGNFLLTEGDTKTCYHIVKDANGNLVEHKHKDAGNEVVNGETVLKEDKQIVYLPFKQLFTGYGWGVKHVPIYDNEAENVFAGVTILGRKEADSVVKFKGITYTTNVNQDHEERTYNVSPISGRVYKLSHLFDLINDDMRVIAGAVTVTVTNLDENGKVTAEFTRSSTSWTDSTIVFSGRGNVRITIQDYYYCIPTSIDVYVRSYPEGSDIHNFTYHHFAKEEGMDHVHEETNFVINESTADMIYNGKHGTYVYDFGFGPEILDYAYKMDSKGIITYTPKQDGSITIGYASQNVGASLAYITGDISGKTKEEIDKMPKTTFAKVRETYTLNVAYMEVKAGTTYTFVRGSGESAIYYIGYLPILDKNIDHHQSYYSSTTATCTKGGVTTFTCLVCGTQYTETTEAFGHHIVKDEEVPATCTTKGKKAGEHCTHCDDMTSGYQEINKTGHTYGENYICTKCGYIDTANSNIKYNITHKMDFTTGKSSDYSELRDYFMPVGPCTYDTVNNYMVMKTTETNQASIEFTVDGPCIVVVVIASTNRENTSTFAMYDSNGNLVGDKNGSTEIATTGVTGTTFVYKIESAGTYRFACTETDRVGRLMTIKVAVSDK